MTKTVFFRISFFVLLMIASWQSLTPQPAKAFEVASDKFLHITCWFILMIALRTGFNGQIVRNSILLFTYSALIEYGQKFVEGRYFSLLDIAANGLGIGLAIGIILLYIKVLQNNTN